MDHALLDRFIRSEAIGVLAGRVHEGGAVAARGIAGSSTTFVAAAVTRITDRPCLLVTAHLDEADEICDELTSFGVDAAGLPALEVLPGETNINVELLGERLRLARRLMDGVAPPLIIAPIPALMQLSPARDRLPALLRTLRVGESLDLTELTGWLDRAGLIRVAAIESPGEFAIRGGIIDVFRPGSVAPMRIDLLDDVIDNLWEIDPDTMGSDRRIEEADILGATAEDARADEGQCSFLEFLPKRAFAILNEVAEISEQARGYYERVTDTSGIASPGEVLSGLAHRAHAVVELNQFSRGSASGPVVALPLGPLPTFAEDTPGAIKELEDFAATQDTIVLCQNAGERERFGELLRDVAPESTIASDVRYLHRGFILRADDDASGGRAAAFVPYHELLHRYHTRRRMRRISTRRMLETFLDLQPGDLVVHRDHGIAKFAGFGPLTGRGKGKGEEEYLTLGFSGGTKLHLPATDIVLVQKYVGALRGRPQLSTLGGRKWKRQKEKVADAVRDLAAEMLQVQAAREAMPGIRYPAETAWQREFEAEFPYEETEDQLAAIGEVKRDMSGERPMDRLICGDVGFGKTEIAIRAAFKAAEYGKQVAVLVPTTVLAEQHDQTFRARFADYPFRIESISRFKTRKEQATILKEVAAGRVDVIIGTHRLLSADVKFADLGLVIIDEEQRFGVEHKQRLLQFRLTADVLTLSATPIPRTLHMSLLGLRDISSLTTPPADRRAIVTEVIAYDERRIQQALQRELAREGQVFFVHNRVYNIQSVADEVQRLVPDARVVIGHGQMSARELERVMLAFMRRQADVLVCTTIIESGIDIPTANTMFINNADMFGLSDLHQLRGRVGRYKHRAYCYLLLPDDRTMTEAAIRRLRAIEDFSMLGAGFKISMRDLELRGAGNLLGAEQTGHISAVGYEMYCSLLQQVVDELQHQEPRRRMECTVDLGVAGSLTRRYIASDQRRLDAYRRIAQAVTSEELSHVERDLVSAYGEPPRRAGILLELAAIRIAAVGVGVRSITRHENDIIFKTADPDALERLFAGAPGSVRRVGRPDHEGVAEIYFRPPKSYLDTDSLLPILRRRLSGEAIRGESMIAAG